MKVEDLTLGDVCDFVGGSQPPKSEFISNEKPGYVRLIQTRDYKTDSFLTYIPESSTKKFCDEKDIMIGRYGPPIFQILRGLKGAYNVALMKAIPKDKIENEYLYYYLTQESLFQYIDGLSLRTGGQTGVDVKMLKQYPIPLPEKPYQQKVQATLGLLDAKIELNNKINAELEAMAKLIYDYWFVQFDFPNNDGKPYKSSGGKMVYNQELKREIPEGWEVKELEDVVNFKNGTGINKSQISDSGLYAVYGSNGVVGKTENYLFKQEVIAIGRVGANYGEVHYSIDPCWITDNAVTAQPKMKRYFWWLLYFLNRVNYKSIAGGSAQPLITQGKLKKLKLPIGQHSIFEDFHDLINPLMMKFEVLEKQNKELSALRDWLLPMLMNGQVRVK